MQSEFLLLSRDHVLLKLTVKRRKKYETNAKTIVIIHIFGNCSANFGEYLLKHFPEIRFHCRKKENRLEMAEEKTVCKMQFCPKNELRNRRSMGAFSSSR